MTGSPGVAITGWGHAVPEAVLTNADWEARLDTSDEWIVERTGIRTRFVGGTTVDLATEAARASLARSGRAPEDLALVVVATTTPDRVIPTTSTDVAGRLGTRCGAFDVSATCAGFVYALILAFGHCAQVRAPVLVVGADTITRLADPTDRAMAVLFGDGAGAVVLEPTDDETDLLGWSLGCDTDPEILNCELGGYMYMAGQEVFYRAVRLASASAREALKDSDLAAEDVDVFIPHQANVRIMDALARRLGVPAERVGSIIDHTGNTSSASIPLAMAELADAGRIGPGSILLLSAFGGGMTVASAVVRWGAAAQAAMTGHATIEARS